MCAWTRHVCTPLRHQPTTECPENVLALVWFLSQPSTAATFLQRPERQVSRLIAREKAFSQRSHSRARSSCTRPRHSALVRMGKGGFNPCKNLCAIEYHCLCAKSSCSCCAPSHAWLSPVISIGCCAKENCQAGLGASEEKTGGEEADCGCIGGEEEYPRVRSVSPTSSTAQPRAFASHAYVPRFCVLSRSAA